MTPKVPAWTPMFAPGVSWAPLISISEWLTEVAALVSPAVRPFNGFRYETGALTFAQIANA